MISSLPIMQNPGEGCWSQALRKGDGYLYDHDQPEAFSGQNYFPDEFKKRPKFYNPPERGFEREIAKRLAYWDSPRKKRGGE